MKIKLVESSEFNGFFDSNNFVDLKDDVKDYIGTLMNETRDPNAKIPHEEQAWNTVYYTLYDSIFEYTEAGNSEYSDAIFEKFANLDYEDKWSVVEWFCDVESPKGFSDIAENELRSIFCKVLDKYGRRLVAYYKWIHSEEDDD